MSNGRYEGVIPHDKVVTIITRDEPELLVGEAEQAGRTLANQRLTKSQIRKIFGTVRQIELSWPTSASEEEQKARVRELWLLKPKLAYQAKRQSAVKPLADVLDVAINQVDGRRDRFQRFVELFEAILAYHTSFGGK